MGLPPEWQSQAEAKKVCSKIIEIGFSRLSEKSPQHSDFICQFPTSVNEKLAKKFEWDKKSSFSARVRAYVLVAEWSLQRKQSQTRNQSYQPFLLDW